MYRKEEKNIDDILYILKNLREEDRDEVKAQLGEDYIQKCLNEIMESKGKFIIGYTKKENIPVCIGGCTSNDEGLGTVWLLCTEEITKHQNCILRNIKEEIELYEKEYWMLGNMLFYKNKLAKKWLKKLGFKFDNPFGIKTPDGFELFYKKRETRGLNNATSTTI